MKKYCLPIPFPFSHFSLWPRPDILAVCPISLYRSVWLWETWECALQNSNHRSKIDQRTQLLHLNPPLRWLSPGFPRDVSRGWLAAVGLLLAHFWETQTPVTVVFGSGTSRRPCQTFLEVYHTLWLFLPSLSSFLPSLFSRELDVHHDLKTLSASSHFPPNLTLCLFLGGPKLIQWLCPLINLALFCDMFLRGLLSDKLLVWEICATKGP